MTIETLTKMQITLTGEQIKQLKAAIKNLKWKRSSVNILKSGLFQIEDGKLYFIATDLDVTVKIKLNESIVMGSNNTKILFPLENLTSIKGIKKESFYQINSTESYNTIEFIDNGIKQKISTFDPKKYPQIPMINQNDVIFNLTVDNNYIVALNDAAQFISKSEARPVLKYVQHINNSIVSTDSHRLFKKQNIFNGELEKSFIVSGQMAKKVYDMFSKEDNIDLTITNEYIQYYNDKIQLIERSSDMKYPDVSRIIPENFKTEFVINKKQLIFTLEQVKKINQKGDRYEYLVKFEITKGQLTISAKSEKGEIENNFNITMNGENLILFANVSYLLDALKQLKDDKIRFNLTGAMGQFTITDSDNYHLLLPVRMNS